VIGFTPSQSLFQSQEPVSAEQLEINNKAITIAEVISFMEETKNVTARIEFFNTFGSNNIFYIMMVARPLLSMRTVGSMDVERMVKPIKHTIMTKHRNRRLKDPKGVALFRLSENLKHIMKAKKMLDKKITESLI
jgi:2-polyprenyl-3-methyl-5-hydroxy-6-metoxy-1,4-benzoquinol methylase